MSKPTLGEIADLRDGRDITRGRIEHAPYLQPTDTVWRDAGWRAYDALLRDDQVAACFGQRRMAVVSRPWAVEAGGERRIDRAAADLVRETLHAIGWDEVTDQMFYARLYGYGVAEVIWQAGTAGIRVAAIRPRDRARFVFGRDGKPKLLTMDNWQGMPLPERKFWVVSVGASHADEPYGRGLAHALHGPVELKRRGARFWGVFLEKFGAPTVLGRFQAGTSNEDQAKLLEAAQAVMTDAGIVLPEGITLELLEASRSGQAGYEIWMHYWDAAIAKVILGQTMTTEDGASRAQAQVHMDVRQDIVKADADLIDESANRSWVRWLVDYTYPGAAYPRIYRDMDDPEDVDARAERDVKLAGIGLTLTPDAVKRVYGDDYAQARPEAGGVAGDAADAVVPALHATRLTGSAQAQAPQRAEPDELDRLVEEAIGEWQPVLDPMADALQAFLEAAEQAGLTAAEVVERLSAALPGLPAERLAERLARAQFAARLAGVHGREPVAED